MPASRYESRIGHDHQAPLKAPMRNEPSTPLWMPSSSGQESWTTGLAHLHCQSSLCQPSSGPGRGVDQPWIAERRRPVQDHPGKPALHYETGRRQPSRAETRGGRALRFPSNRIRAGSPPPASATPRSVGAGGHRGGSPPAGQQGACRRCNDGGAAEPDVQQLEVAPGIKDPAGKHDRQAGDAERQHELCPVGERAPAYRCVLRDEHVLPRR